MPDKLLADKVAIVTGAASGIGRAVARLFLENGASVLVVDLPGQSLTEQFAGDAVHCVEVDVAGADAPARIVGGCVERFGQLDILVNNAGICLAGEFEELTDEHWHRTVDVNVTSMFRISREAVSHMKKRPSGRIINLGSFNSDMAGPGLAAYAMSKHAVAGLTKGMAVDLGKHRITANYLQPGAIVTALSEPFLDDPEFRRYWENKIPLGRLGQPEDVAAAALFLASDNARYVNGMGMKVDGGALANL